jgi:phosphate transport system substrate-binding protein
MKFRLSTLTIVSASLALVLAGCGGSASQTETSSVKLQGAGASFPAPLYNKWFKAYSTAHQNVLVDYQSVGSGSGVKSVIDHTVDFGRAMRR